MQDAAAILSARGIVKKFGGVTALRSGRLDIRLSAITGLLGANGSGKTTLLKILSGIHRPNAGEILMDQSPVHIDSPAHAARLGLGMVHQHLSLVEGMPVWQNIALGVEKKGAFGFARSERDGVSDFCSGFGVALAVDAPVKDLSPGHRQLVEILKALYRRPRILLLDEPTASLDMAEVDKLFTVLRRISGEGVSMVFTSHRMWEVMEICDSATVFRNGDFIEDIDLRGRERDPQYIVSLIAGKELMAPSDRKDSGSKSGKPLARVRGVRLPGFEYADGQAIDLTLNKGEIVGLSGLQGQGQEAFLWAMAGMESRSDFTMDWQGAPRRIRGPRDAIRLGIFLIPGDRNREGLFDQHSIAFNLAYPKLASKSRSALVDDKAIRREALRIMARLSIKAESETTPIRNLSGGNQQKVVLGKWLDRRPSVLLLSDPAKGIDVEAKRQLYEVIKEMTAEGVSVILYASDNSELVTICDRIYVMFEGKIIEEFDGRTVCGEDLTARSLAGKDAGARTRTTEEGCDDGN
jgi:ribose transport system ATP-binding protein